LRYLAAWPAEPFLKTLLENLAGEAGLPTTNPPEGVRLRRAGTMCFAFNYGSAPVRLPDGIASNFLLGSQELAPAGVAIWEKR
jgi:beta-galactosidase